jgi:hypothetical protein
MPWPRHASSVSSCRAGLAGRPGAAGRAGGARARCPGGPRWRRAATSAVPCRHHLEEHQVEPGSTNLGQPGEVGFLAAVGILLGVVGGQPAAGQPRLKLGERALTLPVDGVGQAGQLRASDASWARSTMAAVCSKCGIICWATNTSAWSLAGGWLVSGVAQPAATTAMRIQHPNRCRTLAPLAVACPQLAAAIGQLPAPRDVDPSAGGLTGSPPDPNPGQAARPGREVLKGSWGLT